MFMKNALSTQIDMWKYLLKDSLLAYGDVVRETSPAAASGSAAAFVTLLPGPLLVRSVFAAYFLLSSLFGFIVRAILPLGGRWSPDEMDEGVMAFVLLQQQLI